MFQLNQIELHCDKHVKVGAVLLNQSDTKGGASKDILHQCLWLLTISFPLCFGELFKLHVGCERFLDRVHLVLAVKSETGLHQSVFMGEKKRNPTQRRIPKCLSHQTFGLI